MPHLSAPARCIFITRHSPPGKLRDSRAVEEHSLTGGDDSTMEEKDLRKRKVDLSFSTKVSKPGVISIIKVIHYQNDIMSYFRKLE